ncbi:MAG: nucleotide exchange factor GrpE [Bacteroidales bacterium]
MMMMVKKKTPESEDIKQENDSEIIDNKDNKQTAPGDNDMTESFPVEVTAEYSAENEASSGSDADKVVSQEKAFEAKLAEMQDKYLRLSAEFDNYRKRTLREKMDISKYAEEDLLKVILTFMDDFERALKHMESSPECSAVKEGIDLIYMKLSDFLAQQGIKEIESMNHEFNVELHEAVAQIPVTEEEKKGKIVDVVLKGYFLKDKVIRHSKVIIGG